MAQITTPAQVKGLGSILGIWAHPDDETFMSGGLMTIAVRNGQRVACITATRGEAGVYDPLRWPADTIGATRAVELTNALRIFGVHDHHWLHYRDGMCAQVEEKEAVAQLLPLIEKYQPDTIVTFPPNGITGHNDHKAVSRWAALAVKESKRPIKLLYGVDSAAAYEQYFKIVDEKLNIYFNIDQPDLYAKQECDVALSLSDQIAEKKGQALKEMPSQYAAWLKEFSFDFLCKAFGEEYYVFAGNEHES
jgi:LmbE family N-acetylglucosaminyl deacetylase